jgi:hypothetical protein
VLSTLERFEGNLDTCIFGVVTELDRTLIGEALIVPCMEKQRGRFPAESIPLVMGVSLRSTPRIIAAVSARVHRNPGKPWNSTSRRSCLGKIKNGGFHGERGHVVCLGGEDCGGNSSTGDSKHADLVRSDALLRNQPLGHPGKVIGFVLSGRVTSVHAGGVSGVSLVDQKNVETLCSEHGGGK